MGNYSQKKKIDLVNKIFNLYIFIFTMCEAHIGFNNAYFGSKNSLKK